jgi:Dolichyl-phosphate-mannose-protein mannosyltransferase
MDHSTARTQSAEAFTLGTAPAAPMAGTRRQERVLWRNAPSWWPLVVVLAVQAGLSLRLVRADTAFQDEAAYLWAGHLDWAHWLHGAPVPPFSSYFSGSPAIYPSIAAIADSVGGLTAARILSLVFMLGATVFLWGAANRLYGHRAAFFAAALFAGLGPTLHLGAFATYDAMSVFLVALASWCVIRAGDTGDATWRMVAAGAALALANATAYSSALFDPIVALLALLVAFPKPGGKTAARRIAILLIVVVTLLLIGLLIGGGSYLHGIDVTTLERASGAASAPSVLGDAWSWTGIVLILAVGGIVASVIGREGRARTWLLVLLTIAAILGPLEQANLHTAASLNKHVGLGAWFAAIAAGYAVDRFIMSAAAGRTRLLTASACILALVFPLSLGISQSHTFSTSWPNASSFVTIFRPLADQGTGRMLVEDPSIAEYYLPAGSQWQRWSSTRNIVLPSGASSGGPSQSAGVVGPGNAGTIGLKIEQHYFSIVALNNADTTSLDLKIDADLRRWGYHVIQVVPYGIEVPPIGKGTYVIWRYEPPK